MLATAERLGITFFGIVQQFQWRRVSIIEQNENVFTAVSCMYTGCYRNSCYVCTNGIRPEFWDYGM